jgi:uncharacterized ion transporter superfamily protein YfcC
MNEKIFIREFIKGAESLLAVAFIIGVARGVTIVLNEGHITDSILFYTASLVQGMQPALFILMLLAFYFFFSLFYTILFRHGRIDDADHWSIGNHYKYTGT